MKLLRQENLIIFYSFSRKRNTQKKKEREVEKQTLVSVVALIRERTHVRTTELAIHIHFVDVKSVGYGGEFSSYEEEGMSRIVELLGCVWKE